MGQINYDKEFTKRTVDLIKSFRKRKINYDLDATMLYNCMLGLIVTAVENSKKTGLLNGKVDKGLLSVLPDNIKILKRNSNLISVNKTELQLWEKIDLLRKIRNGIAHQNIEAKNENGKWVGIKIWNVNRNNKTDFEFEISNEMSYDLAIYIAEHYIHKMEKEKVRNKRKKQK